MSLINEALKRAREAQRTHDPSAKPPIRPVESRRWGWDLGLVLPAIIIVLIVTALFFIGLAISRRASKPIFAEQRTITNQLAVVPKPSASTAISAGPAAIVIPAAKTNRLQGIAYNPVRPWAIVGGKTIFVGDLADGLRVMSISRNAVTLVGNGRTNTLVLE